MAALEMNPFFKNSHSIPYTDSDRATMAMNCCAPGSGSRICSRFVTPLSSRVPIWRVGTQTRGLGPYRASYQIVTMRGWPRGAGKKEKKTGKRGRRQAGEY